MGEMEERPRQLAATDDDEVSSLAETGVDSSARTHSDAMAETLDSDSARAEGQRASRRRDPLIGTHLAHFRIDALLGSGGMGTVYRGWDSALERPVAIKVLIDLQPRQRARFLREARAQARTRHPNVVPIHYVGEHRGVVFLSMDLVEGESVADRLARGPLELDEALDIADAVSAALAEGHRCALVHRDVKPSNVLCTNDGRVLLADFGLAKTLGTAEVGAPEPLGEDAALTQRGAIVGTPAYMAPEQSSSSAVDQRADMYALGVTLFEMVTGRRPFDGANSAALIYQHKMEAPPAPTTWAPALPPGVERFILRLLSKEPDARFSDYAQLREALAEARVVPAPSAGFFVRAGAMIVDFVVSLVVMIPIAYGGSELPWRRLTAWVFIALVWGLVEAKWGRTPGKWVFALRVVTGHDDPPPPWRALLRNYLKYSGAILAPAADLLAGYVPAAEKLDPIVIVVWFLVFLVAAGPRKLALHDRLSRTRIVYDLDRGRFFPGKAKGSAVLPRSQPTPPMRSG